MPVGDYSDLFNSAGKAHGIDPDLLRAIATTESHGDPKAVSSQGALGLMQFMPETAKALGNIDPNDPAQAIPAAAKLIAENAKRYGAPDSAVLAYHGGTDQANWGPKTKDYLAKVTKTYQQLKTGGQMAAPAQQSDDAFSAAFDAKPAAKAAPADSGPDAFSAAFEAPKAAATKAAAPSVAPDPVFKKPFGFMDSVTSHLPFANDVPAAAIAGLDTLTGQGAGTFSDKYNANRNQLVANQEQYAAAHPILSPVGTGLSVLAAGKAPPGAVSIVSSLPGRVMSGIKSGGTLGALFGAGEPDDLENRPKNALVGGLTGAAAGAALPVGAAILKPVGKAIGATANAVSEKIGLSVPNYEGRANNMLLNALGRDQVAPSDVATGLLGSDGKPLTALDLAGTNTQRLARNLTTNPGEAGDSVVKFLQGRSEDQSGRVLGDITKHLSDNTDVYGTARNLTQQRTSQAAPLYKEAFEQPAPISDGLKVLEADPDILAGMKTGIKYARREAAAAGEKFDKNAYGITGFNEAGDPIIGGTPTWRTWDAAKQGLDAQIETFRDPVTGKLANNQEVRSLTNLKASLVKQLDGLNPAYKAAREAWSGPSQSNSALNMGQSFMNADPEQIRAAQASFTPSDWDFYKIGAARALQDKANSAADSADLSKRLFGNSRVRHQIETVFGSGASDAFAQAMGAEGKMASTNRFVLGGSNTANKLADAADSHHELAQDILHGGLHGGATGAVVGPAIKAIGKGINNLFNGMHPKVANHLASALTSSGQSASHIYEQLAAEQAARHAAALRTQSLGAGTNRLFSGAAGLGAANASASPQ